MTDEDQPDVVYVDAADLAEQIGRVIYPYPQDYGRQQKLVRLLTLFADEIKRSAVEP